MHWGKSSVVVLLGIAGTVSFSGSAAAAGWVKLDTTRCHTRVAYPFATDCSTSSSGYRLEANCGVNCWQPVTSQRVKNIALSPNQTLWAYTTESKVMRQSAGGSWETMSVFECGTGTERKNLGGIAVTADPDGVETVWLWQQAGRVFSRAFGSDTCWTRGPNIPDDFQQNVELGSYAGIWPWIASSGDLFLFYEGEWILLDSDTGLVGGNNAYVSDQFGHTLWSRSIFDGSWTLDTSWPSSRGLRAITNGSADRSLAVIDGQGKVWRHAP